MYMNRAALVSSVADGLKEVEKMLFIQGQAAKRNAKTVCVSGACKECYVFDFMHYFHTS